MHSTSYSPRALQTIIRFAAPAATLATLATQAHAAIIYTNVTATISNVSDTLHIDLGNGLGAGGSASINSILSGEDFVLDFRNTYGDSDGSTPSLDKPYISGTGSPSGQIRGTSPFALKFAAGDLIGFDQWGLGNDMAIYDSTEGSSPWTPGSTGYLGVRFTDGAESPALHYGWIELTYGINGPNKFLTVSGVAYETTADAPIAAGAIPEPASAAAMAAALAGSVALFRRRQARA